MKIEDLPPVPRSGPAVHPRCTSCGSDDVVADAWAAWDPDDQCWTLQAVFEHAQCQQCGTATELDWLPAAPGPEFGGPAR